MKTRARISNIGLITVALLFSSGRVEPARQSEKQFQQLIRSTRGPDLFRAYCASCHGLDAKGHGPEARKLNTKVADLTLLARNNGGQFPSDRVRRVIMGDDVIASHGSREMPIWGPIFHQVEADLDRGNLRLENLVKYLESIQSVKLTQGQQPSKAPVTGSAPPSGAELYKQNCAACHGNDLKGTGPVPAPFRQPPDLTRLARRNGGRFSDVYVTQVLRNGVKLPAHGPAEMPIWGATFKETERLNETQLASRIAVLVEYIKSNQAK